MLRPRVRQLVFRERRLASQLIIISETVQVLYVCVGGETLFHPLQPQKACFVLFSFSSPKKSRSAARVVAGA